MKSNFFLPDIEDQLERARSLEQTNMTQIDKELKEVERLKSQKQYLKESLFKFLVCLARFFKMCGLGRECGFCKISEVRKTLR